jgi:hypothetical protein
MSYRYYQHYPEEPKPKTKWYYPKVEEDPEIKILWERYRYEQVPTNLDNSRLSLYSRIAK